VGVTFSFYIISWFGNLKEKRKKIHHEQLEWIRKNFGDVQIYILAQDYLEEDYVEDSKIFYIPSIQVSPGEARNKLLKRFYESDEDYGFFIDDDSIITDRFYEPTKFFNDFKAGKFLNEDIDVFIPLNPSTTPFKKTNEDNLLFDTHYTFRRTGILKTSFIILKNINKFNKKQIFFDETFDNLEDIDFAYQMIANRFFVYRCDFLILHEIGSNCSTLFNMVDRRELNIKFKNKLVEKYKKHGIQLNKAGGMNCRKFYNNINQAKTVWYLKK